METTYYLFGKDAVNELNWGGIDALVRERNRLNFQLFAFIETQTKSSEFIEAYSGWKDYTIISGDEYLKLSL